MICTWGVKEIGATGCLVRNQEMLSLFERSRRQFRSPSLFWLRSKVVFIISSASNDLFSLCRATGEKQLGQIVAMFFGPHTNAKIVVITTVLGLVAKCLLKKILTLFQETLFHEQTTNKILCLPQIMRIVLC